ncbi:MAG: hypothetical protein ABSA03_07105 [Streptosporangiaceae bacterium]
MANQPENPGGDSRPVRAAQGKGRLRPPDAGLAGSPRSSAGRGGWRRRLSIVALVLGLAGLAASAAGIVVQILPRRFSTAQQQQIMTWESLRRWREWPASRIFPPAIGYQVPGYLFTASAGLPFTAHRVGIGAERSCAAAADPAAAAVLDRHGCAEMLRATYVDATGSQLVTIGVAVMPGAAATLASISALPSAGGLRSGVLPLAFARTPAAGFGNGERQLSSAIEAGPYVVLSAAGYTDGRPSVPLKSDAYSYGEMDALANGVAVAVGSRIGALPPPPTCPGVPGC